MFGELNLSDHYLVRGVRVKSEWKSRHVNVSEKFVIRVNELGIEEYKIAY